MKLDRFHPIVKYLDEPLIEVGQNIEMPEPKMGWTLFGPWNETSQNYQINLGIIGDLQSLEDTKNFFERLKVFTPGKDKTFLHISFPGLDKLGIKFHIQSTSEITKEEIKQIDDANLLTEKVDISSRIIKEKITSLMEKDPAPHVLVLAYPKKMDEHCIDGVIGMHGYLKKSSSEKRIERRRSQHIILDHFVDSSLLPEKKLDLIDLRSIVKTICVNYNVPIQIIRPKTTESYDPKNSKREDDATTFWNIVVAMFYKANYIPWRIKGLMSDTCYVGISFFRDRDNASNVRTSLAQVFLETEGFVFKGKKAVEDKNRSPHVSKDDATKLIQNIIKVYKRNNNDKLPSRIVVHKTSRYSDDERDGFTEGAKGVHKIDLLTLSSRNIKLVRWGVSPPIRGTFVKLPDGSTLLYTTGHIPYLDVYPGPHVPLPLEILEHHGGSPTDLICKEILALTKLNWNNAKFCIREPITISFAHKVGQILRGSPPDSKIGDIGEKFKFYM